MPNTNPAIDSTTTFDFIRMRAQETAASRMFIVAAATEGRKGEALAPIHALTRAGAVAFSDDGDGIASADMMRHILKTCKAVDRSFMQHCQDQTLTLGASMHDGVTSARLGLVGWPRVAEEVMLERDLRLNREIGCHYHVQHISSGNSVDILRAAREAGVPATGEVSPHHLLLTDEACDGWNTNAKMNPPLREPSDIRALINGVADGVITVLATDHAPHSEAEKCVPFEYAPFGIVGIETALPLYAEALVASGAIDWPRMIAMMTIEPARLCGLDTHGLGTLRVDGPADVTVIDPELEWEICPEDSKSKSRNSPFFGRKVRGRAVLTVRGRNNPPRVAQRCGSVLTQRPQPPQYSQDARSWPRSPPSTRPSPLTSAAHEPEHSHSASSAPMSAPSTTPSSLISAGQIGLLRSEVACGVPP